MAPVLPGQAFPVSVFIISYEEIILSYEPGLRLVGRGPFLLSPGPMGRRGVDGFVKPPWERAFPVQTATNVSTSLASRLRATCSRRLIVPMGAPK